MFQLDLPIRAAVEVAGEHGLVCDRCDVLQHGSTLVLRLSETLVARVVIDREGPRQGTSWFERENAVALHLARAGAPVIPLHPDLPPGPYDHLGYPINFWRFVTLLKDEPRPTLIGETLFRCHELLRSFPDPLPDFAIFTETIELLDTLERRKLFPREILDLFRERLTTSLAALKHRPVQPLHGDAHGGNLLNTTDGLLWTDWEDTFQGPIEWDLASIIWNARILEENHRIADAILDAYGKAGGSIDQIALKQCLIARAAVMSAWYPILYPEPSAERQLKLRRRIEWLAKVSIDQNF